MTTLHQPDEVIATYKFLPSSEGRTSDSSTHRPSSRSSSIDIDLTETYTVDESTHQNIMSLFPRPRPPTRSSSIEPDIYNWLDTSTPPAEEDTHVNTIEEDAHGNNIEVDTHENIITISEVSNDIKKTETETHTHVARVIIGPWTARFLCMYDEPAGVLHNAKVIDMNDSMREATGWRRAQDEKAVTRKGDVEEQRATIAFGIFKKPKSKTVGLCTLKEKDDDGWRSLELRTRGGVDGGEWCGKRGEEGMVSYIAERVVGGVEMGRSKVVESGKSREGDGSSEEEEGRGRRRRREIS